MKILLVFLGQATKKPGVRRRRAAALQYVSPFMRCLCAATQIDEVTGHHDCESLDDNRGYAAAVSFFFLR